mgnify:CR=1 FL=1
MRNPLSKKIIGIEPSGIRKFFDIVSEMPDAISLGVGEPILIHRGMSAKKAFIRWKREEHFIHPMQV